MIYQDPLAYLLGLEGIALLDAWAGDHDREFTDARLAEIRRLLDDEKLPSPPAWTRHAPPSAAAPPRGCSTSGSPSPANSPGPAEQHGLVTATARRPAEAPAATAPPQSATARSRPGRRYRSAARRTPRPAAVVPAPARRPRPVRVGRADRRERSVEHSRRLGRAARPGRRHQRCTLALGRNTASSRTTSAGSSLVRTIVSSRVRQPATDRTNPEPARPDRCRLLLACRSARPDNTGSAALPQRPRWGTRPVTLRRAGALPRRRRRPAVARATPSPRCCAGARGCWCRRSRSILPGG